MNKADETTDNNKDDKDNDDFRKMLDLAEFGVKRMEERRSVEFRIFISYMTLLVLALYQLIKPSSISIELWIRQLIKPEPTSTDLWIEGIKGTLLYLIALSIHFIYVMWQIGVGIAMDNDATRRNFYLKKAEQISGHPLEYPNYNSKYKNEIFPVQNYGQQFLHISIIWTDWSRMLLVTIPTFLFIIIVDLFIKKTDWSFEDNTILIVRIFLFVFEILLFVKLLCCSIHQSKVNRSQQTGN